MTATLSGELWRPPASFDPTKSTWPSNWSTNDSRRAKLPATISVRRTAAHVVGYACYGPIACTVGSYDLYWIAVDPGLAGTGVLGRLLLARSRTSHRVPAGRHIYIETSGRPQYAPTRTFYERCGYQLAAVLNDFYDRGDDKVIWRKEV